MSCQCTKSSRSIYCKLHGDEQYLEKKPVTKTDKKITKLDDKV